ncbi:class I SAM-dependent methyltransferase [Gracilibacillus sp. YIM 98692]|uniref:class I SAM-dependent methyltransferase n=1 Tax=Gracilibacillus sp. YIM 98692 TaxID=2663532 RepID=UPI0013D2A6D3|nr:class I SAM-dependent methyltransferase [Gracilibacillus sp. YIM 98692]
MDFKCVICGSSTCKVIHKTVRDSNDHDVVVCNNCNHFQLAPLPNVEDDENFYNKNSQAKFVSNITVEEARKKALPDTKRRVEFVKNYTNIDSKILDIGCGYGFFVENLNNQGIEVDGLETSESRRLIARKNSKRNILDINLLSDSTPKDYIEKYDMVTLFHVLEHISSPRKFLKNVLKFLKKEGYLIIEVPNVDDHLLSISKAYNNFYWQRAHLSYFNIKSIDLLLSNFKFQTKEFIGVQRYSFLNMANWLINYKPQISGPSFDPPKELGWLNDKYKEQLVSNFKSDTILIVLKK